MQEFQYQVGVLSPLMCIQYNLYPDNMASRQIMQCMYRRKAKSALAQAPVSVCDSVCSKCVTYAIAKAKRAPSKYKDSEGNIPAYRQNLQNIHVSTNAAYATMVEVTSPVFFHTRLLFTNFALFMISNNAVTNRRSASPGRNTLGNRILRH